MSSLAGERTSEVYVPSMPSSGLLLFRVAEAGGREGGSPGDGEEACRETRPPIEVLLFPRLTAGRPGGQGSAFEIPVWELGRPDDDDGPAGRAGLPFEPRPRGEKPRLTAARTMDALLEHACASFAALTGTLPAGPFLPLGGVKMRRHRIVYVWACRGGGLWSGAGRFLALDDARSVIAAQQRRFLEQLDGLVAGELR